MAARSLSPVREGGAEGGPPPSPERDDVAPPGDAPTLRAEELLAGRRSVRIALGEQAYVLRLTRAGKLILTK